MKYASERTIAKPRSQVFQAFTELEKAAERIEDIKKIEILTDGPMQVGTRFRETRVMFGKEATEEMTVTEFSEGEGYTTHANSCGALYKAAYRFEDLDGGTRVRFEFDSQPVSFMAKVMSPVMGVIFGKMLKKCIEKDLDELKTSLES